MFKDRTIDCFLELSIVNYLMRKRYITLECQEIGRFEYP